MELNGLMQWVGCCAVVLCLGALTAVGVLGVLLWSAVGHISRAESRSREMAMSVVEDWRKARQAELDAAKEPPPSPFQRAVDGGFPDEMLPPTPSM